MLVFQRERDWTLNTYTDLMSGFREREREIKVESGAQGIRQRECVGERDIYLLKVVARKRERQIRGQGIRENDYGLDVYRERERLGVRGLDRE